MNREELDKTRIEHGNNVVREHAAISIAGKEIRNKVEKYKQEKIMMDFLTQEHVSKFDRAQNR